MSEEQRFGDGQDNYLQGMRQAAEAARQFGSAAGGAGAAGAAGSAAGEAAANAAAATVKAGVEAGKAVSGIAAGTAVGGPWGAVLSAAWSLRHTLFKILIFICLFLLFIIIAVVSLPSIVFNNIFHTDPSTVDPNGPTEVSANFDDLSAVVSECIQAGYDAALARVDQIIADGGYDYELSMEALVNNALVSADYDTCYALAAYSASMGQRGTTKADLQSKLNAVADQMYRVTYEVKEAQVPAESGEDTDEAGEGSDSESEEEPEMETVEYVVCTIHPFDQSVILDAFGVDVDATYDQFSITYGEAILNMSNALKMTMYGTASDGSVPPISDAELNLFLASLDCSGKRKELMRCALSLVGRVPYFWGGKSAPGWNSEWNTPKLVTSAGSSSTGTIRPYGLDCSGFTEWVYQTALGVTLYDGTWNQWDATHAITEEELLPGDLGFMAVPGTVPVNHVLLYAGEDADGNKLWVHCASGTGVVLNSPDYVTQYRRRNDVDLEGDLVPAALDVEEAGASGRPRVQQCLYDPAQLHRFREAVGRYAGDPQHDRGCVFASACGLPRTDVDAPAGHRKGRGDDHDAAADGRIRAHGDRRRFPAPICHAHRSVLDAASPAPLQEDRLSLWHIRHAQETPGGERLRPPGEGRPSAWSSSRTTSRSKTCETASLKPRTAAT